MKITMMGEGIWPVPVHTKDVQWDLNLLDLPHKSFFPNAHYFLHML